MKRAALRWLCAALSFGLLLALPSWGCQSVELAGRCDLYGFTERLTRSPSTKIDLLLVIDNSRSMAEKQQIFGLAVADLLNELIHPPCVEADGSHASEQPSEPDEPCPAGARRARDPVTDIHVGVLSSSLGGHGADSCDATSILSENDKGHLINRTSTAVGAPDVPGWDGHRFLVWDPSTDYPTHEPQGETDRERLVQNLTAMVEGVGQVGCGYESTLEAWYRFLIEPDPHDGVEIVDHKAELLGRDEVLLAQRREFLRPDSLLLIVMLSDENDCSIRDGGQFYFAAQLYEPGTSNPYHLPKPRAACAEDPSSHCCRSCGQAPADGCSTVADDCDTGPLSNLDDNINLRCFDQKRRFGIDFLWPVERYVTALSSYQVSDRHGNVVPNPLFTDLDPSDSHSTVRDPGLVFVTGIVGVPWQDIARRREDGTPDLLEGLSAEGRAEGGYMSGDELAMNGVWDLVLGDPDSYVPPTDPLMIESVEPRSGTHPITGDPLQPPGAGSVNPINGSEYSIPNRDDLQYACIFELPEPRDCSDPNQLACECPWSGNDNPLCGGENNTTQLRAKANPGIRQLSVLKEVGYRGLVGSICPAQLTDAQQADFGYRPALANILALMGGPTSGMSSCLPRSLPMDGQGQVNCRVVEARATDQCSCPGAGRSPVDPGDAVLPIIEHEPWYDAAGWNCFCNLRQTTGQALTACQHDVSEAPVAADGGPVDGWCYVDAAALHPVGNPDLVAHCPSTEKRSLRFVGGGEIAPGATAFIFCQQDVGECGP